MRLVADTVRGKEMFEALNLLRFSSREASIRLEKLLALCHRELGSQERRQAS